MILARTSITPGGTLGIVLFALAVLCIVVPLFLAWRKKR